MPSAHADPSDLPLVSIVTPSLNQGSFIAATIESVLAQDYPRVEYVVVDGGSTDATLSVLERYASRIRWVSGPDAGQSEAINRGFRMTTGQIVSWLNSDDVLLPGAVRTAVDALGEDPGLDLVYGDGRFIDKNGRVLAPFRFTEPFNWRRLVEVHDYILQPTAFFRRTALEAVGHVDETLDWCMDWDLWIRIGRRARVRYVPAEMASVRVHPATKTSRGALRHYREVVRVVRRYTTRRLPPSLVILGFGALYRAACRCLGIPALVTRPTFLEWWPLSWAASSCDALIVNGRLPGQRDDPELHRATELPVRR